MDRKYTEKEKVGLASGSSGSVCLSRRRERKRQRKKGREGGCLAGLDMEGILFPVITP
jgi:hypothetical protein